jgi:hypothetical protein
MRGGGWQVLVIGVVVVAAAVVASQAVPQNEIDALCELAALWGCAANCSVGCGVCGAFCSDGHITFLDLKGKGLPRLPDSIGELTALTFL